MKKKVLFLLHLPPPVHGSSMVGRFIKDSKKINGSFSGRYINLLASKNLNTTGRFSIRKVINFFKVYIKIFAELRKKPDLCYLALTVTGIAFYRDLIIVSLIKSFGTKLAYHLHNKGVKRNASSFLNHIFYRFVFKDAQVIILSKYLFDDIANYVPKDRICICPNGIPDSTTKSKIPIKNNATVKILYLSNLIETKGVYTLVDACSILKSRGVEFNCDFVGGEGDISKVEFENRVEELGLSDSVHYLGKKYNGEKESIFSSADIFAFPTFYPNECFPLVIIEAMQNALPVISSDEGGIRDLVTNGTTGFIVPKKNSEILANKLNVLIENPVLRTEMGIEGFKRYQNQFILENFEKKLVECLNSFIER